MNTIKSSSKVLLSFYHSSAYELEYSFHIMILAYELAYSLCVMILTCATLCLIIYITCMIRSRAKLRWRFVIPSGLPMSYACRSIGSESWGIWVVSLYIDVVLGYMGTFEYDGAPRLRGRRQVVTALSVPCNPLCSGIMYEFIKSPWLAGRLVPGDLPVHLTLSSNANHVICMIINYFLYGYI